MKEVLCVAYHSQQRAREVIARHDGPQLSSSEGEQPHRRVLYDG